MANLSTNLISVERLAKFKALLVGVMTDKDDAVKSYVNGLLGTLTEGKTVAEMIKAAEEAAVSAASYDDTEVKGLISDLADLVGELPEDAEEDDTVVSYLKGLVDAVAGRVTTAEGDIDALEGRMDTAEGDIDALETKMDTIAEGAQVNVIEKVQLNGTDIEIGEGKVVNVVIPNEDKNLTYTQIMKPDAVEDDPYHGAADKEVTSAYLYNQLATILPGVVSQVNGIFDLASNIQYKTVETYAELEAVDTKEFESGIYVYLVKQDENYLRFEEKDGEPAQYYTTIYLYLTSDPDTGWSLVGKLNVSEALIENATTDAIKRALFVVNDEGVVTDVTKFYTRTEGAAVAQAVADEASRAAGVEGGLDERIQTLESAVGEGGGVSDQIDAKINALDATVTTVTEEDAEPVVNVEITQEDGKLTGVTASIKEGVYATKAQGDKADTALQPADLVIATEAEIEALFADEEEE